MHFLDVHCVVLLKVRHDVLDADAVVVLTLFINGGKAGEGLVLRVIAQINLIRQQISR